MPDNGADLIRLTHDLIASIDRLRDALLEYKEGCETLLGAGQRRRDPGSTMEQVSVLKFGDKRARVKSALREFEAARRKARVELINVAREEGSNLSDVARTLGVSRQLTSRLGREGSGRER